MTSRLSVVPATWMVGLPAAAQGAPSADSLAGGSSSWPVIIPGFTPEMQTKLVVSLGLILALVLVRRGIMFLVEGRVEDATARYRWSKATAYTAFVVGVLLVFQVWFEAIRSLGTFLGLLSAGLAIALKDLVADLAGWMFILWRKPFDLGDRIQIGSHAGDVVDIRIFAFTILEIGNWVAADQSTGRVVHLPNARVFTEPLANYTTGFAYLWNELPVLVTFESDWRKAKKILRAIVDEQARDVTEEAEQAMRQVGRRFLIYYPTLTPTVYTSIQDSGVLLTVRHLCRPRQRRGTAEAIWERILDAFHEHDDIDFAYPTRRLYLNPLEGEEGARAPLPPLGPPPPGPEGAPGR